MKKILMTGATGFIGSNLAKALSSNYELDSVGRDFFKSKLLKKSFSTNVDFVIHCAYSSVSVKDNLKMINILHDTLINSNSMDKRLIVLGTFAAYINNNEFIVESAPITNANFKYLKIKNNISIELAKLAKNNSDIKIIELEPTIVMGLGGGWQRLASKISEINGVVRVPFSGLGVCNVIDVEELAFYVKSLLEVDSNQFNNINYQKFLINGESKLTWRDWLIKYANISEGKIQATNENEWHYNWFINFCMQLYLVRKWGNFSNMKLSNFFSDADYEPRGLDRYAMRCKAIVQTDKIKKFLKIC